MCTNRCPNTSSRPSQRRISLYTIEGCHVHALDLHGFNPEAVSRHVSLGNLLVGGRTLALYAINQGGHFERQPGDQLLTIASHMGWHCLCSDLLLHLLVLVLPTADVLRGLRQLSLQQ